MIYPFWEVNIKRCMLKNFDVTIVIIAIIAVLSEKTTKRTTGSHPVIVCVEEEVMLRASGLLGDVLHFLFFPFRVKRLSLFLRGLSVPLETGEKTMRARGGWGWSAHADSAVATPRLVALWNEGKPLMAREMSAGFSGYAELRQPEIRCVRRLPLRRIEPSFEFARKVRSSCKFLQSKTTVKFRK